jgi:hypothetical protein
MPSLDRAIATSRSLKEALDGEVVRAQGERVLLRKFDVEGLLARATMRGEFNASVVSLEQELALHLREAGRVLGLEEVTLATLAQKAPRETSALSAILAEVRALAGALAELDELNRRLAQRATACVRGYLNAVSSDPAGYDRRGSAPSVAGSTFSGRA